MGGNAHGWGQQQPATRRVQEPPVSLLIFRKLHQSLSPMHGKLNWDKTPPTMEAGGSTANVNLTPPAGNLGPPLLSVSCTSDVPELGLESSSVDSLSPNHPLSPENAVLGLLPLRKLPKRKSDAPDNVIQNPKYLLILEPPTHKLQRNGEFVRFFWTICFRLKLQVSKRISIGRTKNAHTGPSGPNQRHS